MPRRKKDDNPSVTVGSNTGKQLRSAIERIERIAEEKKGLADDQKEIFKELKGMGFDTKIVKTLIKIRAMDADDYDEQEQLLEVYRKAVDTAPGTNEI